MPTFQFGNTAIDYSVKECTSTNDITIAVEWLNGVTVSAPKKTPINKVESALYKKAPWIIKKWSEMSEICAPPAPKEYVSGEKFPYFGRHYRLKVNQTNKHTPISVAFHQGKFIATVPESISDLNRKHSLHKAFKQWYIEHGQSKVEERLDLYSQKMDVTPTSLALKEQRLRWGTCTVKGSIYLNWHLVMAPMSVIDYVLVHELAHLKYPNHSQHFWRLVRSILPDYNQRKEWLRINGPRLTIE